METKALDGGGGKNLLYVNPISSQMVVTVDDFNRNSSNNGGVRMMMLSPQWTETGEKRSVWKTRRGR